MAHYRPPSPDAVKKVGTWWSWSAAERAHAEKGEVEQVTEPIEMGGEAHEGVKAGHGLVATLRNVFIPTPNPDLAPAHPADPIEGGSGEMEGSSPTPSIASTSSGGSTCKTGKRRSRAGGKLVDYINTLEISRPEDKDGKEAVVVLHGYAAALG